MRIYARPCTVCAPRSTVTFAVSVIDTHAPNAARAIDSKRMRHAKRQRNSCCFAHILDSEWEKNQIAFDFIWAMRQHVRRSFSVHGQQTHQQYVLLLFVGVCFSYTHLSWILLVVFVPRSLPSTHANCCRLFFIFTFSFTFLFLLLLLLLLLYFISWLVFRFNAAIDDAMWRHEKRLTVTMMSKANERLICERPNKKLYASRANKEYNFLAGREGWQPNDSSVARSIPFAFRTKYGEITFFFG